MSTHRHHDEKTSSHSHPHAKGHQRALVLVLVLTVTYLVAEVIGGVLSGSLALIADAGHMALDVAAVMLGLFASWIASLPPTLKKTYGYYRAEILAALTNAITLVLVSFWIFYEAWQRFGAPPEVRGGVMAVIAAGGLVVNVLGLLLLHGSKEHGLNMRGVWLHMLTDALGSVAALVGGFLILEFQWYWVDPLISIILGVLILFGAWKLLVECVDVLLVSVPKEIDAARIKNDIETLSEVKELHDLHIWAVSHQVYALSAHVRLKYDTELGGVLNRISRLLKENYQIDHTTLQIEPPTFEHEGAHFCEPGKSGHEPHR